MSRTVPVIFAVVSAAALSAAALAAHQQDLPPPFPRTNATRLLETDRINVWDIVWPKGQPTALHRHVYDQVGTYYARGGRLITAIDGTERRGMTEVGSLSTTRKGTTHVEEGTTDPPLRAVFIELKQDGPTGAPAAHAGAPAFPRDGAKQVLDDDRVTAWDYTWTSGGQTLKYRAPLDTVIVWLAEGTVRAGGKGVPTSFDVKPGTMRYLAKGADETLEVTSGSPRTLFFQLK
jgi:hypothetical protein